MCYNLFMYMILTDKMKVKALSRNYSYFSHRDCEFFPCHKGADKDDFNCLFCYCPLYSLGDECGGDFTINAKGIKDCTDCLYPHIRENYDEIIAKLRNANKEIRSGRKE